MASAAASIPERERSSWSIGARSETGFVRKANEDRMGWVRTSFGDVYVVSDGMGGYKGGALAAELTVSSLQQSLAQLAPRSKSFEEKVRQAFLEANDAVYRRRDPNDPNTREMGATAVALIIDGSRFMVAHVGDSRAYRWRWFPGLRRLTKDHTRVQKLIDEGVVKEADAESHPEA
ncbi:MAG TPA: protein phosphatase 2C domain-containing protein, partial [Steroidobacter sp.]